MTLWPFAGVVSLVKTEMLNFASANPHAMRATKAIATKAFTLRLHRNRAKGSVDAHSVP